MDLNEQRSIKSAVDTAISRFGHIDVLVNNAGGHCIGAVEETSEDELRYVMEQNFFSMVRVIQAFLSHFRKRRSGHIFNMTSVAGLVGVMGFGAISAAKFAMEGLSEALSMELGPLGIRLTIVEPVQVRTNILADSTTWIQNNIPAYDATAGETRAFMQGVAGKQVNDPARIAAVIAKVADSPKPPLHLPLGTTCHIHLRGKYARILKDVEAWQHLSLDVEFPAEHAPSIPLEEEAILQRVRKETWEKIIPRNESSAA